MTTNHGHSGSPRINSWEDVTLTNLYKAIRLVYGRVWYLSLFAVSSVIYYAIISYLVAYQDRGIQFFALPVYFIYLNAIAGGFLLSVSIFYLLNYRIGYGTGVSVSAGSAVLTGIVSGCGCSAPVAFGVFSFLAGTSSAIYAIDFMSAYAPYIVSAIAIAEIGIGLFYLSRIYNANCKLR